MISDNYMQENLRFFFFLMLPLIRHSHYFFPHTRTSSGIRNMLLWDSLDEQLSANAVERAHRGTGKHQQCCKQRYGTHSQNTVATFD